MAVLMVGAVSYERGTPVALELVDHPEGGANREWGENNIRLRMEGQRVSLKWRDSPGGWVGGMCGAGMAQRSRYWSYWKF